jgi:thioesterase domain-containing protein/acyl carrier protein
MAARKSSSTGKLWNEPALRERLVDQLAGMLRTHRAEVDPDKSFDEYGLDSIDAVIASGQIGEELGIELPPEFLLYHRSINAVVYALLNSRRTETPANAPQAKEAVIFLFPGGGGRDERSLIRFREQSAPTLNFEVVGFGDWREWIEQDLDFDKLATRACFHIEALQSEGPVRLAGYSQGGQLAYASALTLARAGRPVEFVGLLDSVAQRPTEPAPSEAGVMQRALHLAGRYIGAVMRGRMHPYKDMRIRLMRALWRLCRGPAERRKLLRLIARAGMLFRGAGGLRLNSYIQIGLFAELWGAWFAQNCHAQSLHSPVFLFRSGDPGLPDRGWAACCTDLTVVPIAGDHLTIFDAEHLEGLITRFVAAVRREAYSKRPRADGPAKSSAEQNAEDATVSAMQDPSSADCWVSERRNYRS